MHFCALSAFHENSFDCAKVKEVNFEDTSTAEKLSIITFMEEVEPTVIEKGEFEYRGVLKLTFFGIFGLSD